MVRSQCISNATTVYPLLASCLMDNSLAGTRDAPGLAMSRRLFKDLKIFLEKSREDRTKISWTLSSKILQACFCLDRESVELPSKGQNSLLLVPWTLNWLLFDEETWEARRRERICWVRRYSVGLFHVLKLYNLPPLFSNYIFYCASK